MKIAVTAATGQLGSAIISALKKEIGNERIVGIARNLENATELGIELRKGDYNNRQQFDEALKGVDAVILISGMDDPAKRVQQHRNVIEAAKLNKLQKIVYTSIVGSEEETAFAPIVQSNRQTEKDIQASGLDWVIGRNGIYIEPDLAYIDRYVEKGWISNCASDGKCGYTSRSELGFAYGRMMLDNNHKGQTYNLTGELLSQSELAALINQIYHTDLYFKSMSVESYAQERKAELGDYLGNIIAGIYDEIRNGHNEVQSDYQKAAERPHQPALKMIEAFKMKNQQSKADIRL